MLSEHQLCIAITLEDLFLHIHIGGTISEPGNKIELEYNLCSTYISLMYLMQQVKA